MRGRGRIDPARWAKDNWLALLVLLPLGLGTLWCLREAQYLVFSAPAGRLIVSQAGLDRAVSITVAGADGARTPACSDHEVLSEFRAWVRLATGKRQHEYGGPTEDEIWYLRLDDGREIDLHFWCVGCPGADGEGVITAGVYVGGEQCLLRLWRDEFRWLRERMGADPNGDLERLQRAGCGEVAIGPAPVARFDPVEDSTGALAYSGEGLCLGYPGAGVTAGLHPVVQSVRRVADWGFAWSPEGDRIAFVHSVIGPPLECWLGYLMLADLESGEVRAMEGAAQVYDSLAWSPDGERLAFITREARGTGHLGVLELRRGVSWLGGDTAWWQEGGAVAWLDGAHVAYIRVNGAEAQHASDLVSRAAEGGEPQVLVPGAEGPFALSPDRKQAAWSGGSEVFVATLETGESFALGSVPDLRSLQWAPDGRHILALGGLSDLYLAQPVAGQSWRHLDLGGVPADPQAWSPDGRGFVVFPAGEEGAAGVGFYDVQDGSLRSLPIAVARPWDLAWAPVREPTPVSEQ